MLKERGVAPFSKWEKELPKIVFDPRFKVGRIQVIAFQSLDGKQNHVAKPVVLSPVHKSSFIDIESSRSSSDHTLAVFGSSKGNMEQDTGDSGAIPIASKV